MQPLVSIIIPTFNRYCLIGETLESVLAQTYQNWECIVVDDGSSDYTDKLMEFYCLLDSRICFHKRPEIKIKGASSCRNYGLKLSKGELIQFLDSDDLLQKNKLEEQTKLSKNSLELITCKWGWFEESSDLETRFKFKYSSYRNYTKGINLLRTFGKKNEFLPSHVYLTPKSLINKAGWWDESISNNDDAEFFTRIILKASKIKFSSTTSVYYRNSGSDKLSAFTKKEKVLSAIKSWKLIETHIKKQYPEKDLVYVKNAKNFLKNTIQKKYPEIVNQEKEFFKTDRFVSLRYKICYKLIFLRYKMKST